MFMISSQRAFAMFRTIALSLLGNGSHIILLFAVSPVMTNRPTRNTFGQGRFTCRCGVGSQRGCCFRHCSSSFPWCLEPHFATPVFSVGIARSDARWKIVALSSVPSSTTDAER